MFFFILFFNKYLKRFSIDSLSYTLYIYIYSDLLVFFHDLILVYFYKFLGIYLTGQYTVVYSVP